MKFNGIVDLTIYNVKKTGKNFSLEDWKYKWFNKEKNTIGSSWGYSNQINIKAPTIFLNS